MPSLVVGSYPPAPGRAALGTLAEVVRLLDEGVAVEVLSPVPGAAHHHGRLRGLSGALTLARWAGRAGRDGRFHALVLRLEPGLPLAPSPTAPVECLALAAALARWRHVTLSVDDAAAAVPLPLAARPARLLWRQADAVVVTTDDDRRRLRDEAGVPADRVSVRGGGRAPSGHEPGAERAQGEGAPGGGGSGGPARPGCPRAVLMARVRARAAATRLAADPTPPGPPEKAERPAPATVAGRALAMAKRVVRCLLGSRADAVLGPLYRFRLAVADVVRGRRR